MRLEIHRVQAEDFTSYKCVAKNSLGETDGKIRLFGKIELCHEQKTMVPFNNTSFDNLSFSNTNINRKVGFYLNLTQQRLRRSQEQQGVRIGFCPGQCLLSQIPDVSVEIPLLQ